MIYQHERDEDQQARRPARAPRLPRPAPDLDVKMGAYLAKRGLSPILANFNMWYPSRDAGDTSPRIVIPCSPAELGYWQARAMDDNPKRYQSPFAARGGAIVVVYPERGIVRRLAVVEGPMDALAAAGCGYVGIGLMGNTPPTEVFEYIAKTWPGAYVRVLPDSDAIGAGSAWTGALRSVGLEAEMQLIPGKDLAALRPSARKELLA